jgi:hypothetical protein
MPELITNGATVHVRFEGHSRDVPLHALDVGPQAGDADLKCALAAYLQVPEGKLSEYVIDRHASGNLTVRPEAVFG